jgi:hypothetical protein
MKDKMGILSGFEPRLRPFEVLGELWQTARRLGQ